MPSFTIQQQFNAPLERVFGYVTDLDRAPDRIEGITRLEIVDESSASQRVGEGTHFRETRTMFGKECTEEMVISSFDPPSGYDVVCENHGCRYESRFRLSATETGTNLSMTFDATPLTVVAKIFCFIFRPMLKSCFKQCAKDLADLERSLDADGGVVAPSGASTEQESKSA